MSSFWLMSFRLLGGAYHGRRDRGEPEWPPSPHRAFQALVRAAAALGPISPEAREALEFLEALPPPFVIAPPAVLGAGYVASVPHNAMDVVARAWSRGNESNKGDASPATHRTMKRVRASWLQGGDTVSFAWPLPVPLDEAVANHCRVLHQIAGHVVALGWGVDLAVGMASICAATDVDGLSGDRWLPDPSDTDNPLRVPIGGTLSDLEQRHDAFRSRVSAEGLGSPPLLSAFRVIGYRRDVDPRPRRVAGFALLKPDEDAFRPFDPVRRGLTVAGMLRGATAQVAHDAGWPTEATGAVVLGHPSTGMTESAPARLMFIPLPSLEARGNGGRLVVGEIRRVLIAPTSHAIENEVEWLGRAMSGADLVDEQSKEIVAVLSPLARNDRALDRYARSAAAWSTVTPVVLPGYDDPAHYRRRIQGGVPADEQKDLLEKLAARIEALLRKAIVHAGYSETLARHADLEWRKSGFVPGVDMADRYGVPDHLARFPRWHVRIAWRDEHGAPLRIRGPVCLGGGRFYGVGLFAALDD